MRTRWKLWEKWLSCVLAAVLLLTAVPVPAMAQMAEEGQEKPTSIVTADGNAVQVEESWEDVYPYGAFLFATSDAAIAEGGEEAVITLYRLGGTQGRATAYVVYAPVVTQLTEDKTSYGSAAGFGDVELSVEDALPIAGYQPVGKDPDPEPSEVKVLERAAEDEAVEPTDRVLYLDAEADRWQWQGCWEGRWQNVEGAVDAEFVVSREMLEQVDIRCVFYKDGVGFCTESLKGEAYVKPEEEILEEQPEELELNPEKSFTEVQMDPENPYSAIILPMTFADGEWSKEIKVKAPENEKSQPLRFGTFVIYDNKGGAIYQPASMVTLKVEDNDAAEPYTIGFASAEVSADVSEGEAVVRIRRTGGGQEPVTVEYTTADGTAIAGKDYESVSGTAAFYADVDEVMVRIPLLDGGEKSDEPKNFKVALGEIKGDGEGLCTLTDTEALITLTGGAAADEEESEESTEKTAGEAVDVLEEEAEEVRELPSGGLAGAIKAGAETMSTGPVTGTQVTSDEDSLIHGHIAGFDGTGGGGPLRTFRYGLITFDEPHGGNYWGDRAYVAGQSPNTLTNWTKGEASGNGWKIKDDTDAAANLYIDNMSQMYSGFYGYFSFSVEPCSGWKLTPGYAYGKAGVFTSSGSLRNEISPEPWTDYYVVYWELHWKRNSGSIDTSWNLGEDVRGIALKIVEVDHSSEDDAYCSISDGYLNRRVFNGNMNLTIHTANDGESGNGNTATAPENCAAFTKSSSVYDSMRPEVIVEENAGGVDNRGKLYVGSKLRITLKNTDSYKPYSGEKLNAAVYVTRDSNNAIVPAEVAPGNGGSYYVTMLWDGMTEADLRDSYTLNIVMTRSQELELNLQPSVERKVNKDGSMSGEIDPSKVGEAWDAFWKSGGDTITVGYSETTSKAPHFSSEVIAEKEYRKSDWSLGDTNPLKLLGPLDNVQYINFNRSSEDRITINGKMYRGNERIYLSVADLAFKKLSFTYYAEKYLNMPNIMNVSISRVELYFDGNGDGRIAGAYNGETGYFVLDKDTEDTFEMLLEEDASYDEVMFQPVKLENGKYGQYFAKLYYTMTPRSLDSSSSGRAQVLPALTTSRTDRESFELLTEEQQSYRYLLSGTEADGSRTSDDHPMYGAEASAIQFVDVPLGGDHSPLQETEKDVYAWDPKYEGNLIYDFDNPEPIFIEHSLVGDNYPLAEIDYQQQNGITMAAEGKANLNGYLGSMVGDTTIALCVTEQRLTSDQLHETPESEKNLRPESSALSRRSSAPNGAYLTQVDSGSMGKDGFDTADSGQDYPEFNLDYNVDLPVVTQSFQGLSTIVLGKNTLSILISIPIYSKTSKNGGKADGSWFPKTITAPFNSSLDQIIAYGDGMKNGSYTEIEKALKDSGYQQKTKGGSLSMSKVSGTVSFSAIFTFKYDTRKNNWYLQEFVFGAGGSVSLSYNIRLAACPLFYIFLSATGSATLTTGGTFLRKVIEAKQPIVASGTVKKLKKGDSLPFSTPYVNANIDFSGKIYIKTEAVGDEKVNNGYVKSKGGEKVQLQFKSSKRTMTFDDEKKARNITIVALEDTTINYLNIIEDVESELTWSGFKLAPKIIAEFGAGAGVEGLKAEVFIKSMISAGFTFGKPMADGSREGATVDNAMFKLSLAIRAVFLMSSWEMDAVGVKAAYDGTTDKWTTSYVLLGEDKPMRSANGLAGAGEEASSSHLPIAMDDTQEIYSSQPGSGEQSQTLRALQGLLAAYKPEDSGVPFQLSGYNSSADAFRLADGLELGCDYKVVAVGGAYYVVYTIGRPGGKGMDTTMLALSRLVLKGEDGGRIAGTENGAAGDGLGLVNPLDWEEYTDADGTVRRAVKAPGERSLTPYILVDLKKNAEGQLEDDGAGDLDFDVQAIDGKIYVTWVSYASPVPNPDPDARVMLQNAAKNTVVREAFYDVAQKEGFTEAVDLSASEGGAAVYLPKIVNGKYTVYGKAVHADDAKRAELVETYVQKLNSLGYYKDQGSDANRSIFKFRLETYENTLDCKGIGSALCVCERSGSGTEANTKLYEFATAGGSEAGYASSEPIAPINKLAVFELGDADIGVAYTTWMEDVNAAGNDLQNVSALYLTSFKKSAENGLVCPYGHLAVSSEELDTHKQNDTLLAYMERTDGADAPETTLFVGQGGKVFIIPCARVSAFLKAKDSSRQILEKTAFSGGDNIERTGFSFGEDGDGNLVAVYVSTVDNTTNTGIFLSVFDKKTNAWGAGTILAMRHMDVFEDAVKYGWSDEDAQNAYLGELSGYSDAEGKGRGGMDQLQFSNPQIAIGVGQKDTSAEGEDGNTKTTLTILTQGMMRYLAYRDAEGQRFLITGADPYEGAAYKEGLGFYAITYGIGSQSLGQAHLSFVNEHFTAGAELVANLSFVNTGDAAIRGSEDYPATVSLSVSGEGLPETVLATWKVEDNIYAGRQVNLTGDFVLPADLPAGAGFNLSVSEDASYAEDPYSAALKDIYTIKSLPELGFETSEITLSTMDNGSLALDGEGNALLDVDLFIGNRGSEKVKNAYLQFSYGIYDPDLAETVRDLVGGEAAWNDVIYKPLDITGHSLKVGEEEPLLLRASSKSGAGEAKGLLTLGSLQPGYGRHVRGQIAVPASVFEIFGDAWTAADVGSLKIAVEIFSDGDEVTEDTFGCYQTAHGEYNRSNNRSERIIEHATNFTVPIHLELPVGTQLRLPVFYTSTLGDKEPEITIVELMDREVGDTSSINGEQSTEPRTDMLAWKRGTYKNGQGQGTLLLRGARTGISYLRIQDSMTNAYKDINVIFTAAEEGIDITNANDMFTYFDAAGQKVAMGDTAWKFQKSILTWRKDEKPFNETLAAGSVGTSFQFVTEAETISLDFDGKVTISSDFPGFAPITLEDQGMIQQITLGENPEGIPYTVTVTVVEPAYPGTEDNYAYFDKLVESYAGDGADDKEKWKDAGDVDLIFGSDFPEAESLEAGQVFDMTVYGVIDGVLPSYAESTLTCSGDNVTVLSCEHTPWENTGTRFEMKVRFSGNGPVTFRLDNDKHEEYTHTVDVDWWKTWSSAFTRNDDPVYQTYAKKYPELEERVLAADIAGSQGDPEVLEYSWLHVEPDESGYAITISVDPDAPAESFAVTAGTYAEYLATGGGSYTHVLGRGESVTIPADEDSVMLVNAEALKKKGEDASLAYEIRRADGTVEKYNAGDAYYFNNIVMRVPYAEELIAFKAQSLVLSGKIGVNFYMNLPVIPDIDYGTSFMEFTVCGETTEAAYDKDNKDSSGRYYRFTRPINSVQMADEILAVYHYFKGGEEKTLSKVYSAKQYIVDFETKGGFGKEVTALVRALADYGHYAQIYLSGIRGWEIGTDHLPMDIYYTDGYSFKERTRVKAALQKWDVAVTKAADVSRVSYSLYLDSGTGIYVYFTMKNGYSGDVQASVNGSPQTAEKLEDGRYRVQIVDIAAHKLGMTYKVALASNAGTTTVDVSAFSYVYNALKEKDNDVKMNAMMAIYHYYDAAMTYLNNA